MFRLSRCRTWVPKNVLRKTDSMKSVLELYNRVCCLDQELFVVMDVLIHRT